MLGLLLLSAAMLRGVDASEVEASQANEDSGVVEAEEEDEINDYRRAIRLLDPMEISGVELELSRVLVNYYQYTFGDEANWERVSSIRFLGKLHIAEGPSVDFVAFKKAPDFSKVVVYANGNLLQVRSYDGEDAWQANYSHSKQPESMPPADAANFIRDATIGGHLLYPLIPSKQMTKLSGLRKVEGELCYVVTVDLPSGQSIVSYIDIETYLEIRQDTVNEATGMVEVVTHKEFRSVDGVQVPTRSELRVDGELVHTVEMLDVSFNKGAMPWMFARESGSKVPPLNVLAKPTVDPVFERPSEPDSNNLEFGQPVFGTSSVFDLAEGHNENVKAHGTEDTADAWVPLD